jgi:hypothetical protein
MTPVISRMWKTETARRFRKSFRIPTHFVGEPPQIAAQPPLAVAKNKFQLPFYFPFLIAVYFYF